MNAATIQRRFDAAEFSLVCTGVKKRFSGIAVLDGIDLAIPRGAVLGLIGRNGAGKTTLIRVLVGLLILLC